MKYYKLIFVISWLFLLSFQNLFSQENKEHLIVYDSIIGKENLALTNGLFHFNNFNIVDKQNIYYYKENYTSGSINYLDQDYYAKKIKYDVYNDELIFTPSGNSEKTGVILIKNNVKSFEIYNTKFINIEKIEVENLKETGYYEEGFSNMDFKFLIKQKKTKKDILKQNTLQNVFYENQKFYILKNKKLERLNSKSNLIKLFPSEKEIINSYFKDNKILKKLNKSAFYKNLFNKF